jgi:hypothetical protein
LSGRVRPSCLCLRLFVPVFFAALTRGVEDETFDNGIQKYLDTVGVSGEWVAVGGVGMWRRCQWGVVGAGMWRGWRGCVVGMWRGWRGCVAGMWRGWQWLGGVDGWWVVSWARTATIHHAVLPFDCRPPQSYPPLLTLTASTSTSILLYPTPTFR